MKKPRAGRHVKNASAALARTNLPVEVLAPRGKASAGDAAVARVTRTVGMGRALDGLFNIVAGIGTGRDKRTSTGYARTMLHRHDLDAVYTSSGLAGRGIDKPVTDMLRPGWTRSWDGVDKDQQSVKLLEAAERRLAVKAKFKAGMTWGRLYGGCGVVMVLRNENLLAPLNLATVKRGSLQCLNVMDRWRITASGKVDKDPNSPNFGEPLTYRIAESGIEVHWSRVIIFGGRMTPYFVKNMGFNGGWDDSILQRVIETVKNFDAGEAAIASMLYEASVDVLSYDGLAEMLAKPGGEDRVEKRLLTAMLSKSIWKTLVIDGGKNGVGGDKYDRKPITFSGVEQAMNRLATSVCVAFEMPMTTLFGESPGGLNATGEHSQDNWDDTVDGMRTDLLAPALDQLDEVMIRSTLGRMPENYSRTFNPLRQMDPLQGAQIRKLNAETFQIYFNIGAVTGGLVARELKAENVFKTMEDKDVALAEEMDATEEPLPAAGAPAAGGAPAPAGDVPGANLAEE